MTCFRKRHNASTYIFLYLLGGGLVLWKILLTMFNPLQGYYLACDNGGDPNNDCSKLNLHFALPCALFSNCQIDNISFVCFRMLQRLEGPDDEHGV